jgi:HK97 family phage major capsid protein
MSSNIASLIESRRKIASDAADAIITRAADANRPLTEVERIELDSHMDEIRALSARLADVGAETRSDTLAPIPQARGVGGAIVRNEPTTYQKGGRYSHVADMARAACQQADNATLERLQRHAQEMDVELRAGDTGDTAGGTFVPPKWVVEEFVGVQRAGRATADLARRLGLPGGTDQVNIPTITTGTVTDVQATENTAATTRDMVTGSTTADVSTIAGTYDFSLQLLEQSALARGFDQLIYADLLADYNRRLDVMVLNGTGANNQASGIHTVAATTVYASSTSSTTAQNQIYAALGDAINRVATTRFDAPDVLVMHPRRWFWLCSRLDLDGRPPPSLVPGVRHPHRPPTPLIRYEIGQAPVLRVVDRRGRPRASRALRQVPGTTIRRISRTDRPGQDAAPDRARRRTRRLRHRRPRGPDRMHGRSAVGPPRDPRPPRARPDPTGFATGCDDRTHPAKLARHR